MGRFKGLDPHDMRLAVLNALSADAIQNARNSRAYFLRAVEQIKERTIDPSPISYDLDQRGHAYNVADRDIDDAIHWLNEIKHYQNIASDLAKVKLRLHKDVDFNDGGATLRLINKAEKLGTIPLE